MKKIIIYKKNLLMMSFLFLSACAEKKDDVVLQDVKSESVGPFTIDFSGGDTYQQKASGTPESNEAKIEFYAYSDSAYQIVLQDAKLQVSGCDASQVKFNIFWIPNLDEAPTMGINIKKDSRVQVYSKIKSSMLVSFQNLQNCSRLDIDINLKKVPLPDKTYGTWISNSVSVADPYHVMRLDVSQLATSVQGVFQVTCDDINTEKITTEMIYNNELEMPKKMIFKINRVDTIASGSCSKQFKAIQSKDLRSRTSHLLHT